MVVSFSSDILAVEILNRKVWEFRVVVANEEASNVGHKKYGWAPLSDDVALDCGTSS
jgi:hypothetical protein